MVEKTIKIGEVVFDVTDPLGIEPVFAEVYTELRINGGVLVVSLATIISDGDNKPEARIVARLRMPLDTIRNITAGIDRIILANAPPAATEAVN